MPENRLPTNDVYLKTTPNERTINPMQYLEPRNPHQRVKSLRTDGSNKKLANLGDLMDP